MLCPDYRRRGNVTQRLWASWPANPRASPSGHNKLNFPRGFVFVAWRRCLALLRDGIWSRGSPGNRIISRFSSAACIASGFGSSLLVASSRVNSMTSSGPCRNASCPDAPWLCWRLPSHLLRQPFRIHSANRRHRRCYLHWMQGPANRSYCAKQEPGWQATARFSPSSHPASAFTWPRLPKTPTRSGIAVRKPRCRRSRSTCLNGDTSTSTSSRHRQNRHAARGR